MGLVYHAHYVDYFEAARTEFLREMGLPYKTLEESGILMPVVDLAIQYRRPAFYDDLLEIVARVEDIPDSRVRIEYEVRRSDEEQQLVTGHVTLCFVDAERGRPVRAPEPFRALFADAHRAEPPHS